MRISKKALQIYFHFYVEQTRIIILIMDSVELHTVKIKRMVQKEKFYFKNK